MAQKTKVCTHCRKRKSLDNFYRHKKSPLGRAYLCKSCHNVQRLKWGRNNPDLLSTYVRRWSIKNKEKVKKYTLASRLRHPEKLKAGNYLRGAVRDGLIVKPPKCSECKRSLPAREIHAHHEDYSKRLDVVWLCARCHGLLHRKQA